MGRYHDILVPTDGSTGTRRAIEEGAALAAEHGATLHALYVVNTASFATLQLEANVEGVSTLLQREGDQALDEVEEIAADYGVPVERVFREGAPSREIVDYAEELGVDLVVMGTHSRGGIDRLLLGSVAEKVVRASRVPVMTVRVGDDTTDEADGSTATEADGEASEEATAFESANG
ncbi:universal stress protein [Halospeciosus flavus]|uniref:Universal stress protein n=1 Tax=Halospeciosus flavus TaxID=3032283 RepID=A0ABD5Z1A9_9EURY|nr:universal stress protein [Halospeciosus flavus]